MKAHGHTLMPWGEDTLLAKHICEFWAFVGLEGMIKRAQQIKDEAKKSTIYSAHHLGKYRLVIEGGWLAQFYRDYKIPYGPILDRDTQLELYEFISACASTIPKLTNHAKDYFRIKLCEAIRDRKDGLSPVACELAIATHFQRAGCELFHRDLEERGHGYDYLITCDGSEIEVECKFISHNKGSAFESRIIARIADTVMGALEARRAVDYKGVVAELRVPGRLRGGDNDVQRLRTAVEKLAEAPELTIIQESDFTLAIRNFDFSGKEPGDGDLCSAIQRAAGLRPMFNTMLWFPDDNAIRPAVVSISSDQNADVASAYGRDLRKDAGRQFTKTRPAILAVELAALCWDDFLIRLQPRLSALAGVRSSMGLCSSPGACIHMQEAHSHNFQRTTFTRFDRDTFAVIRTSITKKYVSRLQFWTIKSLVRHRFSSSHSAKTWAQRSGQKIIRRAHSRVYVAMVPATKHTN
jgi:hypothetical protein